MKSYLKYPALLLATMLSFSAMHAYADDTASAANLPEPAAPMHATLNDGRVEVYIGTPRVAAYQIGDSIPVRIVFILESDAQFKAAQAAKAVSDNTPSVVPTTTVAGGDKAMPVPPAMLDWPLVEVSGLKMGVVTDKPSDVELLVPATVQQYVREDGKKMVVAEFYATTYVTTTQTQIGIAADFMYAVSKLPDGQPDWRSASTPEMPVGITRSATANQTLLLEGDLGEKPGPKAVAAQWAVWGSIPLAIPMVVALGLITFRRITRKRSLTRNERTWQTLDGIVESAAGRFTLEHYRRIFYALRDNLDVLGKDTTQTLKSLSARAGLDLASVQDVFNRETLFFDPNKSITADQHDKLMQSIGKLIPRQ
jgi:hypothetical protein